MRILDHYIYKTLLLLILIIIPKSVMGAPASAPVISAIPDQTATQNVSYSLNLAAYVTAGTQPIASYTLSGTLPTGLSFDTSSGVLSGTPTSTGSYNLTLTSTSTNNQVSDPRSFTLTVNVANMSPTASFNTSITYLVVSFTDTSTDSDGSIASWAWNFGDGNSATSQNPSHTYASAGTYTVELTVTDDDGATDTITQNVTVVAGNTPPTASFSTISTDLTVDFTDTSTDSDGSIASWAWDFGDGNSASSQNPSHTYASAGTYTVELTVTDNDGDTDTTTVSVTVVVGNLAPTASFTTSATLLSVQFTDTSTDSDGTIVSWAWNFGDGNSATSQNPSHTYASAGTYTVELTVTDDDGDTDTTTKDITVLSNNNPIANDKSYTTPFETSISGNVITDAPADSDADGDTLTIDSNTNVSNGTLTLSSDGNFTYTPNNGYDGNDTFTYTITDGNGGTDTATITITVDPFTNIPNYQNNYACGVFGNVLVTYDHLTVSGTNEQVCGTGEIAYPAGQISGTIDCLADSTCTGTASLCDRTDPPDNRYSHSFPTNSLSGSAHGSNPTTLTDLEYGDLTYSSTTVDLEPSTTYSNSSIKVMLLGDFAMEQTTLNFEPGDYYFDSLTINSNNNAMYLPSGGVVRIFIKGDFNVQLNNLDLNNDVGSSADNLFIYVNGNLIDNGSGGGTSWGKAYFYVEGDVDLNNNSNNWRLYGGITAEGAIDISGNNPDFIASGDADNFGLGDCTLCFTTPSYGANTVSVDIYNLGGVEISDLNVTKAYASSFTNSGVNIISDNAGASASYESSVTVDFDGYTNFPNPSTKQGYSYAIGDYASDQQDTLEDTNNVTFNLDDYNTSQTTTVSALYIGDYYDDDRPYHVIIEPCGWSADITYLTGPYDAWDTFRGDTFGSDAIIDDKNISTKITNDPFTLTIANLDENGTGLELKEGIASQVTYGLYSHSSMTPISGTGGNTFDANSTTSISHTFTVPIASEVVHVGFIFCASYDGSLYTLEDDSECNVGTLLTCGATSTDPEFRLCHSTDGFAVRPDEFSLQAPTGEDIELLTSAQTYNFTVTADDVAGSPSNDYNQTGDLLDLNETLILSDGITEDTTGLLHGELELTTTAFSFNNGTSTDGTNSEVVGIKFDDVGQVKIQLHDKIWANIDDDDTPLSCDGDTFNNGMVNLNVPYGMYICGDQNATYIPSHFEIQNFVLSNNKSTRPFTYLTWNDDLNMSAAIAVNIIARNAEDNTVQNFTGGDSSTYYENPMTAILTVPTTDDNSALITDGAGNALVSIKQDIDTATYLGFGSGTRSIAWNDTNTTHRLMFNYNKVINRPINPFDLNMTTATAANQMVSLDIASRYPETGTTTDGNTATVTGEANATGGARFYFARVKASKDLYDDVQASNIDTPILALVYCDLWVNCGTDYGIDTANGLITGTNDWWLSWDHNTALGDGNITLLTPITDITGGAGNTPVVSPNVTNIVSGGQDGTINVASGGSNNLPMTVGIDLVTNTSLTNFTSPWMIYDATSMAGPTPPLYRVIFRGTSGWTGVGETGNVLDINASSRKTRRLNW